MNKTEDMNQALCKKLWLEYEPMLRRLCEYKLNSHLSEVDDIIADTFLYLWKAIDSGLEIKCPRPWLLAVVNNLIKKKYEELRIARETNVSFDEEAFELRILASELDIDEVRITDSMIEFVKEEIINNLKDEERAIYKYIYEDKLKLKQIALKENLTEAAVKMRHYRLARKIKLAASKKIEKL